MQKCCTKLINLKCGIPKRIPVVFHNRLNYDYHFIIKGLVKETDGEFNCPGENNENTNTFQ